MTHTKELVDRTYPDEKRQLEIEIFQREQILSEYEEQRYSAFYHGLDCDDSVFWANLGDERDCVYQVQKELSTLRQRLASVSQRRGFLVKDEE